MVIWVYIENTRYKAIIGNNVYDVPKMDYDYEVEYLESTGTQWIVLDYYANNNTCINVKWERCNSTAWTDWFGSCGNSNKTQWFLIQLQNTSSLYCFYGYNSSTLSIPSTTTIFIGNLNKHVWTINGAKKTFSSAQTFRSDTKLGIFSATGYGSNQCSANRNTRIYYFQVLDNDELIFDFIPVVKNNVGYLYDKVSKQLFGNQGTGDFLIGPKVN